MSNTFNYTGKVISETIDGVSHPVDYSFEKVNDFVHGDAEYEELQWLCLGMATAIADMKKASLELVDFELNTELEDRLNKITTVNTPTVITKRK